MTQFLALSFCPLRVRRMQLSLFPRALACLLLPIAARRR